MDKLKKRDRILLVALMAVLILVTAGVAVYFTQSSRSQDKETVANQPEEKQYEIYWNADREAFKDIETGASTRVADADGKFTLRFVHNGEIVSFRARNKKLVYQVDAKKVMGLEVDDKGWIQKVIDIEEFTGGYAALDFYVESMDDDKLIANSSTYFSGKQLIVKLADKIPFYDVSETAKVMGEKVTKALLQDRVTAIKDKAGKLLAVFLTERSGNDGVAVYCPHCKEEVFWKAWTSDVKLPSMNGHWKLTTDVNLQTHGRAAESNVVVLDLNGHTVNGNTDARVITMDKQNGSYAFMDLSKEQTGKVVAKGKVSAGGICYMAYGVLEIYGGVFDASQVTSTANGSAIAVQPGCVFNLYDGTIIGGTAQCTPKDDMSGTSGGGAGSVNVVGIFKMYDGTIKNGTAKPYYDPVKKTYAGGAGGNVNVSGKGEFYMYGGEILNGTGIRGGGNVQLAKGTVAYMEGGLIAGGVSKEEGRHGGNLYVAADSVFNMSGGKIQNGKTSGEGGNAIIFGTLNMTGGSITGGTCLVNGKRNADSLSHNVFVNYGELKMSAGTIDGYVRVIDSSSAKAKVSLSGTAKITGGKTNLYLGGSQAIKVDTMKSGAKIGISAAGSFSEETASGNAKYFYSDYDKTSILHVEKKLYAGRKACLCGQVAGMHSDGCSEKEVLWLPWLKTTSMPTTTGNYYLISDVNMAVIQATIAENNAVALDLNGHTVLGPAEKRIYSTYLGGVTLSITDTSKAQTGVLKVNSVKDGDAGLGVWAAAKTGTTSKFTLYAGTIDASAAESKANGAAVTVTAGVDFKMYGGKIVGGTTKGSGGSVFVQGDFAMYDGVITGGKAPKGGAGNVLVDGTGKFLMAGGTISNGVANINGGNVYVKGIFTMDNGVISGGEAVQNGGNIYVVSGQTETTELFTMNGGLIENGKANGATVNLGGGNVYVAANTGVTMNDGTISGGSALGEKGTGGNVLVCNAGASFRMTGGTIKNGQSKTQGGNVAVRIGGNFYMSGTSVMTDGVSTASNGGNFALVGGKAEIFGGRIVGGKAGAGEKPENHTAANVYFNNAQGNSFIMSGGTIAGRMLVNGTAGSLRFTGNPVISHETGKPNLTMAVGVPGAGALLDISALGAEANIHISTNVTAVAGTDKYYFTTANTATTKNDYQKIIVDNYTATGFDETTKQMYVIDTSAGGGTTTLKCYCGGYGVGVAGHTCENLEWTEWTQTGALPYQAGNYKLMVDVNTVATASLPKNGRINLDLNGHTITNTKVDKKIYACNYTGGVLNITDSSATYATKPGTMKIDAILNNTKGSLIYAGTASGDTGAGAVINFWNGVMDGRAATGSKQNGLLVSVERGTFNMYGGTMIGGQITNGKRSNIMVGGGSGAQNSFFNMYGGTIRDGVSTGNCGNICANVTGKISIYGGTISGGNASSGNGGNIMVQGELLLAGGTISGGTASIGANIYIEKGTYTKTGGTIENEATTVFDARTTSN